MLASVATAALTAAAVVAPVAPASADPGRAAAGPLSYSKGALPGWEFRGPDTDRTVVAVAPLPGKNWVSLVELGLTGIQGRSAADVARAITVAMPESPGYRGLNATVQGLAVTPTTISGIPAARATAWIKVEGGPVAGDRFRLTVVDTKPQTYFLTAVPNEAPERLGQADRAEASLTATR
ncbi:hypothetical protein GCM10027289_18100 [Tsukamurella serpentis]